MPSLPHSSAHAARHGTRSPSSPCAPAAPLLLRRPATPPSAFPRRELRGRLAAPAHALTALSLASMPHHHARYKPRRAPFSLSPASSSPRHGRAAAKPRRRAAPPLSLHPAVSLGLQTSAPHSPHSPLPFPCTQSPNARREQSAAASHSAAPTPATRSPSSAHPRPQPYSQRASWPLTGPPKPLTTALKPPVSCRRGTDLRRPSAPVELHSPTLLRPR